MTQTQAAEEAAQASPSSLTVFTSFPSQYTQSLILQALTSIVPRLSLSFEPPVDVKAIPALQWADYDLLNLDAIQSNPSTQQISSYVYRKTLIRKQNLHNAIQEYLAKQRYRGNTSALETGVPKGWTVDIQMADELDELLMDELYDLREVLQENEDKDEKDRKWFILKPGMSDKAQGIRLFSSEDELVNIFEEFEEHSDEDEEEDEDETDEAESESAEAGATPAQPTEEALRSLILSDFPDDEPYVPETDGEEEDGQDDYGTGVRTSQLRHFVIQEYIDRPLLFNPTPDNEVEGGHKFHLRAYVLLTGTYKLYLSRTMLALFAGEVYTPPGGESLDLQAHLTNTCLQSAVDGSLPEHLVKLFWDLEGQTALAFNGVSLGDVTAPWLQVTFAKVGEVISEAVKAGVECGSFGLQLMPNAFEVFGVDLLLSVTGESLSEPTVTLLEFNASPDFGQSGDRLRPHLADMFKGVVRLAILPFFGCEAMDGEKEEKGMELEETRHGWKMIGQAATRGQW